MGLLKILTEPNKVLRQKSLVVEQVDQELQQLMNDMVETMYAAPGIGLAAIQVGIPKRVLVLDISRKEGFKEPMYFINPEVIEKSKNISTYEEGCLSIPGQFAEIDRPDGCHIKYLDYYGHPKELKARTMLATCIQHEMDHLEGVLFIDYLSKLKKSMILKKLSKNKPDRIIV